MHSRETRHPVTLRSPYHAVDALGMRRAAMIRVLIADEIARIVDDLDKLAPYSDDVEVCGVAHQPSAVIEEAWLRQPDVLVLRESFADVTEAGFGERLASGSPATRVLLMTSDESQPAAAWIAGAVDESVEGAELVAAIRMASEHVPDADHEKAAPRAAGDGPELEPPRREIRIQRGRATVIVAFSGKGGTGTSMVATNLAVALAETAGMRTALVDTDLQFGDAAGMLHVENHQLSVADLAQRGEGIDGPGLDAALAPGPAGVRVVRAPASPELAETVTAASLRAIVRGVAKAHDFVVVDTPSQLDERVLECFELADRLLLITSYNLSAVRSTKATLLMLEALGVDRDRVEVVLNHTRPRVNYRREDIEKILGRGVLVDLPHDPRVDASVDAGTPIVLAEPASELSRALTALALLFVPSEAGTAEATVEIAPPSPPLTYRRRFSLGRGKVAP